MDHQAKDLADALVINSQTRQQEKPFVGGGTIVMDGSFNESDHPRADNGQFGAGGGSSSEKKGTSKPDPELEEFGDRELTRMMDAGNLSTSQERQVRKEQKRRAESSSKSETAKSSPKTHAAEAKRLHSEADAKMNSAKNPTEENEAYGMKLKAQWHDEQHKKNAPFSEA